MEKPSHKFRTKISLFVFPNILFIGIFIGLFIRNDPVHQYLFIGLGILLMVGWTVAAIRNNVAVNEETVILTTAFHQTVIPRKDIYAVKYAYRHGSRGRDIPCFDLYTGAEQEPFHIPLNLLSRGAKRKIAELLDVQNCPWQPH